MKYKEYKEGRYIIRKWDDGDKVWWFEGKVHRENGPAFEMENGYKEWWLDDREYTEAEWKYEMRKCKLAVLGI